MNGVALSRASTVGDQRRFPCLSTSEFSGSKIAMYTSKLMSRISLRLKAADHYHKIATLKEDECYKGLQIFCQKKSSQNSSFQLGETTLMMKQMTFHIVVFFKMTAVSHFF